MLDRIRRPITPETYRRITAVALGLLILIVVTGASVRLTGSGLGCSDWPNCTDEQFVAPMEFHPMVEFVNRLVTGLVSVAVALAVLGSLRRAPRRRDLTWLSLGLVVGVVAQILVGRIVVISGLNPWWVQGHMVVSVLLVLDAAVLTHRAGRPDGVPVRPAVTPATMWWGRAMMAMASLVVLTGTLVTGSGPHSGHNENDVSEIRRLPLAVHDAARIHGIIVMVFLAITVWLLVQLRRHGAHHRLLTASTGLLTLLILQGSLGYVQYFSEVPPLLVGLHVFGSMLVWVAALDVLLNLKVPVTANGPLESAGSSPRDSDHEYDAGHLPYGDLVS